MQFGVPAVLRLTIACGLAVIGLQVPLTAAQASISAPFSCVPRFYQVSATNSGAFFEYSAATNSLSRVGTGAVSGINGIGYNTADNYIYGVSGTKLYRLDSAGAYNAGTTITGSVGSVGGGDFYGGKLVVAPTSGNSWSAIDVTSATATSNALTSAANGHAASAAWAAYDLTVQGDVAYGLNNSTLYIVKMDTRQVSSRAVTGVTSGNYGAAYSDSAGNAFFYNNNDNKVYMFTPAELAKATGSATAPAGAMVGLGASTPALTAPNDGASCPIAVSPYVPSIDDASTSSSVDGDSATLTGSMNPNNSTTSTAFCFGTSPTLAGCETVVATPGTISGNTPQQFAASVTDLAPGTTYYYQVVGTNSIGTNVGEIHSFTTDSAPTEPQTITFAQPSDMTVGAATQALDAEASSGLPVTFSSQTPEVCTISAGHVAAVTAGSCTIAADQAGDEGFDPAPQVTRSLTVAPAVVEPLDQTIDFAQPGALTAGADQVLDAEATSGLPVSYTSQTPTICSVADGAVVALLPGTCTVAADQAGNEEYDAAPQVTKSFEVSAIAQTITFEPMDDVVFGDDVADADATADSGLPVTITSSTPQVCSVDGTDVVALMAGTCTLVASQDGDATHAAAEPVEASFDISKADQTVTLGAVDDLKVDHGPAHVDVTTSRDVVPGVESLTPAVCTLGAEGTVNLVAAGTCTIRAWVDADETHNGAEDSTSFEVLTAFVVTPPAPVDTPSGSPVDVVVPATGGVGPYTWTVTEDDNNELPDGLTLDPETGRITGTPTKPGLYTVKISVTDADGEVVVRSIVFTVASALTGDAPSGRRTVLAGNQLWLPDRTDGTETWSYGLPTSLQQVRTTNGRLWLRASALSSGRFEVPLTVTDGVVTQTGAFRVTVLPRRVDSGTYRLDEGLVSLLRWAPEPGAQGYRVYVDGHLVGRTSEPSLSLARPLGPRSRVTVRTEGNDSCSRTLVGCATSPRQGRPGPTSEPSSTSAPTLPTWTGPTGRSCDGWPRRSARAGSVTCRSPASPTAAAASSRTRRCRSVGPRAFGSS